jgi:DNA-binding response OmpR family regulator/EAL domain-containing protein (putative c-di-GMP-specific phosphodiesterase class I)
MSVIPAASSTPEPTGGAIEHSLRLQTRELVTGWRELMRREWNAERVSALHEEVEKLAAAADAKGVKEIADPALELTVYLCSFVDEGVHPDAAQQRELQALIDALASMCGMAPMLRMAHKNLPEHRHGNVLYLRRNTEDIAGLAAQLGQRGYVVRSCKDSQHLLLTLDTLSPDVLIVDEAFVAELHPLIEAVERRRPPHKDPALCLVLTHGDDDAKTLFARRAGANAVTKNHDPIAIAVCIDELLAQRHALGYRVLIVEDDRGQAKFCESILRHRGMVTSICDAAAQVTATIAQFKPDLVLLDLYLPDANGIEVAQRIREQTGTAFLPIVFLSGEHDPDLRFNAISVGADDFITKPVKPRHLITAVESRVRRTRQLSSGQPGERAERRGTLSGREAFAHEVMRIAREEQERCPTLALVAVDEPERILRDAGFVASGTIAQQIAAALAAEIKGMRTLCASGELKYLVARCPQDENTAREEFEALRKALDARLWGSTEAPQRLRFRIGCLRLPATTGSIEEPLQHAQALCQQAPSGTSCEFDLRAQQVQNTEDAPQRMLRLVLRAHSLGAAAHFLFQPILQLGGHLTGQYAARMHLAPTDAHAQLHMDHAEYIRRAQAMDLAGQADRLSLRALLELVRERNASAQELRLHVPISVDSAVDTTFAPWLAAELGSHGTSGALLVLHLTAEQLRGRADALRPALEALQRLGLRLGMQLSTLEPKMVHELLHIEAIQVVDVHRASEAQWSWADCASLVSQARSLGKTVLMSGVQNLDEIGVVLRLGAHYVQADVLAGWSPDWNFEFAAVSTI